DYKAKDSGAEVPVMIDSILFRQVFVNIIRNGVEANLERIVGFSIQLCLDEESDAIKIKITNDGKPIPKDLAPRIFDPYISNKNGKDNMGLGLSIVKKIIIEHGGEIFHIEENSHPTFVILLRREVQ
ncbi:MAG: ATP-binding protein, partial [Oligoflexia bacterium]|nr:ATP-binding protein [Oligoflexia bacterium]